MRQHDERARVAGRHRDGGIVERGPVRGGEQLLDLGDEVADGRRHRRAHEAGCYDDSFDRPPKTSGLDRGNGPSPPDEVTPGSAGRAASQDVTRRAAAPVASRPSTREEPTCRPKPMPTARSCSARRPSSTRSAARSTTPTPPCSPSTAGSTVTELADLRARAAAGGDRLQDLQEHARPPRRERRRPRPSSSSCSRARSRSRSSQDGGDAVTAAKALRDFARTNPNLVVKGGLLGAARADDRRRRGARRRAAPRGAARPARRRLPGPARQGRRPAPGVHPQLRLRPQGAHRPAGRRRRGARRAPSRADAAAERRRGARRRGSRRARAPSRRRAPRPTPKPAAEDRAPEPKRTEPRPTADRVREQQEQAPWQP